jgi:imidazolonepropionase-like amidohydrolase
MSRRVSRTLTVVVVATAAVACHTNGSSQRNPRGDEPAPATGNGTWLVIGARGLDGDLTFGVRENRVVAPGDVPASSPKVDLTGFFVVPAFIDSHVHLAYYPVADGLPAGGVVGAVDFAAPVEHLSDAFPIEITQSGPMITSPLGYPTQGWGHDGFGVEVANADEATRAVDRLLDAGATFIKTPLAGTEGPDDAMFAAIVERAHSRGARVAVHALGAVDAGRAIAGGADILGHTPTERLADDVLSAFGERTVVSTLSAFGATEEAIDNLRTLAQHGALVLYGTDLGNTQTVGIQPAEIDALARAGLTGSQIVRSATSDAARFWGFSELGALEPGLRASFLVLGENPDDNSQTLAAPHAVIFDGRLVAGALP